MISDISKLPLVKILWTGGFDSTLRMAELSRYEVAIQPYYLIDRKYRRSVKFRNHLWFKALNKIRLRAL